MARRRTPLDTLKTFLASPMELVALGDAIHFYIDAAQHGHLPHDKHKHVSRYYRAFKPA